MTKRPSKKNVSAFSQNAEYTVGYGRPPRHSQFDRCGNPRGRPPKDRSPNIVVGDLLNQKVIVREGGKTKKLRKGELGLARLVNKFAETGDPKLFKTLVEACPEFTGLKAGDALQALVHERAHPSEAEVLAWYRDRLNEQWRSAAEPLGNTEEAPDDRF